MPTEFRRQMQLRGTTSDWALNDITLLRGEIALENTGAAWRAKIGDGSAAWSALPYAFETDPTARGLANDALNAVASLDLRVVPLESIPATVSLLSSRVDSAEAAVASKQDQLPAAASAGDLLSWDGATWGVSLMTLAQGSMMFWNNSARAWEQVPPGAPGQALVYQPTGRPAWGDPGSITATIGNRTLALSGGASVEGAFNAEAPTILSNEAITVTWEGQAFHYVGAPGTAITTATAADFTLIGYTTSGIADAPSDGKTYGRKDAAWSEVKPTNTAEPVSVPGTTMTLALADAGRYLAFTDAAGCAITFPTNAAVALPIGTIIRFEQAGGGSAPLTFAGDTGVTIRKRSTKTAATAEDGAVVHAIKTSENEWTIWGDLA